MFYRYTADLCFTDNQAPSQLKGIAVALMQHAVVINPGQDNEERGFIRIHKCYHDQDPNKECELEFESLVAD